MIVIRFVGLAGSKAAGLPLAHGPEGMDVGDARPHDLQRTLAGLEFRTRQRPRPVAA